MPRHLAVQLDPVKQQHRVLKRLLRRLLHDLIVVTGTSVADLASKPRRQPRQTKRRVLYRRGDSYTDADLFQVMDEIGAERILSALDAYTQPQQLVAAE
jgi:hypothetical protein